MVRGPGDFPGHPNTTMQIKKSLLTGGVLVAALCSLSASHVHAAVSSFSDIEFWVGSGSREATLVIAFNSPASPSGTYAWGYRWDGPDPSGAAMILAVADADPALTLTSGGTALEGFFLSSVTYDVGGLTYSATSDFAPGADVSWGYYIDGGSAGDAPVTGVGKSDYPAPWTASPTGASQTSFGSPGRILADGAWDAWSFGPYDPGSFDHVTPPATSPLAAVPEPSALTLVGAATLVLIPRRRRS